jgi:hypothetical protein
MPYNQSKHQGFSVVISIFLIQLFLKKRMDFVLCLVIIFSLFGCVKDGDLGNQLTEVNIAAMDAFTHAPLDSQLFEILAYSSAFCLECGGGNAIAYLYTDSNGVIKHNFNNEADSYYEVRHSLYGKYKNPSYRARYYYRIKEGDVNNFAFELKPTAKVNIRFQHDATSGYDHCVISISRTKHEGNSDYDYLDVPNFSEKLGQDIDTILVYYLMKEEEYTIKSSINKMGSGEESKEKPMTFRVERPDSLKINFKF